ncbi:MAG: PrgI family protein [Clostridia bacterium]|nr:PrgI family protein [Clostridia bacterium]
MGSYYIPRNLKGEGRILFIFSKKALVFTCAGAGVGSIFYLILKIFGFQMVGFIIMGFLGLIGFCIGTLKIPDTQNFKLARKLGGSTIDDVIKRAIKFKLKKNKIYVYEREEKNDEK